MSHPALRRRYPIPTHLAVEPALLRAEFGPLPVELTFRQAAILACAAGLLYWLWQGSGLPVGPALGLSGLLGLLALAAAFVTIGGRAADLWLCDLLHYAGRPRRLVWRPHEPSAQPRPSGAIATAPAPIVTWASPIAPNRRLAAPQ
jgi:hypothetical protein